MGKRLDYEVNIDKPRTTVHDKKLFQECNKYINENYNSNFHWGGLSWVTRVWLGVLFSILDKRLNNIEKEIEERTII